jgi:hypothetical protein
MELLQSTLFLADRFGIDPGRQERGFAAKSHTHIPGVLRMDRITSFHQSGERYKSLRVLGALFTLIGAVLLAAGGLLLVFGVYILLSGTTGEPSPGAGPFATRQLGALSLATRLGGTVFLLWSFALLLSGLQLIAGAALFRLLIHLEENMRASAQSLDKIRMRLESRVGNVEPLFRS